MRAYDERDAPLAGTELLLGELVVARGDGSRWVTATEPCPFEIRYLAETGFPHPGAFDGPTAPLTTDLHSHFAACATGAELVSLGLEADLTMPSVLLDEAGVRGPHGPVALRSLATPVLERLENALALPMDRQSTFRDMERAYRLRGPFTKSLALFPAMLDTVAASYAAMGARYVELSLGDVYRRDWLTLAVDGARRAHERHGLSLRFLTAVSRHDDAEWDLDLIDRIEALGPCRELVGVDFMGHETNSTRAFADRLTRLAKWASANRPGFVIRVHAGENPAFPENVRVAVEAVAGERVTLRIGHALYGVDEHTTALLAKNGAWVELNFTSNYTLNNVREAGDVPLSRLLAAGVRCVLGTDGPGLYGTTLAGELRAAICAGLAPPEVALLREHDARYVELQRELAGPLPATWQVPADAPFRHFTPALAARKKAEHREHARRVREALGQHGVAWLDDDEVRRVVAGHPVVSIAGAWRGAWATMSDRSRQRVEAVLAELLPRLPHDTILVTGGTSAGVEGVVHRLAPPLNLLVLAAVVEASPIEELGAGPARAWMVSSTPHEKAARLYELMREVDALCLFFGGGNVVHDELRAAANLRLRFLALADVDGASGDFARAVPHRAFHSAGDAIARLFDREYFRKAFEPFWHPGVNPTVDVVVLRGDQVLLVRRRDDAAAEPGQWALPGGFVRTRAAKGQPFAFDVETPATAAVREVRQEAGLDVSALAGELTLIAEVEGGGRDERDSPVAWSRTWLFRLELDAAHAELPIAGGDDVQDARWFALTSLPHRLAFDHGALLARALRADASRSRRAVP